jgi:glucose dehydrogenase
LWAINANTGDIVWHVPLGSYRELEAKGMKNTGAPNLGGPILTASGLTFIGATSDQRFRAFDTRTGKELWMTDLENEANSTPITYMGRDGKQYVVIVPTGPGGPARKSNPYYKTDFGDSVVAFTLPSPPAP